MLAIDSNADLGNPSHKGTVGENVGADVGLDVGLGVKGVGENVGIDVGVGVGAGVGAEVGAAVGLGVGADVASTTRNKIPLPGPSWTELPLAPYSEKYFTSMM